MRELLTLITFENYILAVEYITHFYIGWVSLLIGLSTTAGLFLFARKKFSELSFYQ
jgi:hypothetical protein